MTIFGPARLEDRQNPLQHHYGGLPVSGTITSLFGETRSTGDHTGVDIAAPDGTLVQAPAPAVVDFDSDPEDLGVLGHYVVLRHPAGDRTLYAHLTEPSFLVEGAKVRRGDVIGRVGETGRATGPHLHWMHAPPGNRWLRRSHPDGFLDPLQSLGQIGSIADAPRVAERFEVSGTAGGLPVELTVLRTIESKDD